MDRALALWQQPYPISGHRLLTRAYADRASIDECKDWSDKDEVMRSYARQAKNDTMYKTVQGLVPSIELRFAEQRVLARIRLGLTEPVRK